MLSAASLIENAEHFRLLFWGIPVTLIVAGSVFLEQETPVRFPKLLTLIGDSSYSTYLLHVFVVMAGATLLKHGYFTAPFVADLLALTVVVGALVLGYVAYFLLERNLQQYLKAKVSGF